MQRIIVKRLVTVAAMVAMVLAIVVPAFAQILPQGESRVTDPVSDGGSVPEDVTSTQPNSTEDVVLPTTDAANDPTAPAVGGAAEQARLRPGRAALVGDRGDHQLGSWGSAGPAGFGQATPTSSR